MRRIVAIEKGFSTERYVQFDITSKLGDDALYAAIADACVEYSKTLEIEKIRDRAGALNWADVVVNVPNWICEKHGFKKSEPEPVFMVSSWEQRFDEIETAGLMDEIRKGV